MATCRVYQCTKPVRFREMCSAHYSRFLRYGHPLGTPPPRDLMAELYRRIDRSDVGCWLYDTVVEDRVPRVKRDGKKVEARRLVYEDTYGRLPGGTILRSVCGHKRCVRPDHQRADFASAAAAQRYSAA